VATALDYRGRTARLKVDYGQLRYWRSACREQLAGSYMRAPETRRSVHSLLGKHLALDLHGCVTVQTEGDYRLQKAHVLLGKLGRHLILV